MGCGSSSGPYPADIPPSAALPSDIEILGQDDKEAVQNAIDICARSFAGTAKSPPAQEFHWMLGDADMSDEAKQKERAEQTAAAMGFCVHYAFLLGQGGLVLQAKPGAWEGSGTNDGKPACIAILQVYPTKYSTSTMKLMSAFSASGASKWTKAQKDFMNGKKMAALDAVLGKVHKKHASDGHIYLQVLAVDPEAQGSGLGRKMLVALNKYADVMGLPLYLECSGEKNPKIYEKFGYTTVGKEDVTATDKGGTEELPGGLIVMRREPTSG
jgi:ribosomal protein S18 acetylase RimI-like enzyme